jgi:hypothetical protein
MLDENEADAVSLIVMLGEALIEELPVAEIVSVLEAVIKDEPEDDALALAEEDGETVGEIEADEDTDEVALGDVDVDGVRLALTVVERLALTEILGDGETLLLTDSDQVIDGDGEFD